MKNQIVAILAGTLLSGTAFAGDLPNPNLTPGVTNPDVSQSTIRSTICVSGWTATVRPPASYTDRLKMLQIKEYGYADTLPADYEEDHLIPLELGGNPTDPHNLWPQPHYSNTGWTSSKKDHLENVLKGMVCSGKVALQQARTDIATNWIDAYHKYIGQ